MVWACGPWLPALFPDLVQASVTRQEVVFFGVGPEWAAPGVPGWIDHDHAMYGTGDVAGKGFKIASDQSTAPLSTPTRVTGPRPAAVDHCRRYLARRFPGHRRRPGHPHPHLPVHLDADSEWIVAPHPDHPSVWLVGGGSGHGFKHGPALGEYVDPADRGRRAAPPRARARPS